MALGSLILLANFSLLSISAWEIFYRLWPIIFIAIGLEIIFARRSRWLSTLITYTLEALLSDPLYGGNTNGIGWKWLGHDPGNPRPSADKIYGRLGRT